MTFFFGDMTIVNGFIKQLIAEEHHLLSAFLHPMLWCFMGNMMNNREILWHPAFKRTHMLLTSGCVQQGAFGMWQLAQLAYIGIFGIPMLANANPYWLVVSTPLIYISQLGSLFPTNVPNHPLYESTMQPLTMPSSMAVKWQYPSTKWGVSAVGALNSKHWLRTGFSIHRLYKSLWNKLVKYDNSI